MQYRVKWEIDIEAINPYRAARIALNIQRDPESTATVFEVIPIPNRVDSDKSCVIDLSEKKRKRQ